MATATKRKHPARRKRTAARGKRGQRRRRSRRIGLWLAVMVAFSALLIWVAVQVAQRGGNAAFELPSPPGGDAPEITDSERKRLNEVFESLERARES